MDPKKIIKAVIFVSVLTFFLISRKSQVPERLPAARNFVQVVQKSKTTTGGAPVVLESFENQVPTQSRPEEQTSESSLDAFNELEPYLFSETKAWGQKLPEPRGLQQKTLWSILHIAHQGEAEIIAHLLAESGRFLRADEATQMYLDACLETLETGRDQKVRNFIYSFAKAGFPNRSFGPEILKDYETLLENPNAFGADDQQSLQTAILTAPDISSDLKLSLSSDQF